METNSYGMFYNHSWICDRTSDDGGFLPCRHINGSGILFFSTEEMVELSRAVFMFMVYQHGAAWRIWIRNLVVWKKLFFTPSGICIAGIDTNLVVSWETGIS